MRRPTALAVATDLSRDDTKDVYELSQQSPRSLAPSLPPAYDCEKGPEPVPTTTTTTTTAEETPAGPAPSIALLFSCLSRRDLLLFVLPAVLTSMLDGGVAPFMTRVIGNQFDVFAAHPLHGATAADNRALLHGVGMAALELLGLSAAALVLSSLTSSLWICAGERNVAAVRKRVFGRVADMPMSWFDTHMGTDGSVQSEGGPIGAGGLMAKFARETDDVRTASSLASGFLIQYLTTFIACLALAFQRSWSLTLVILSAVPALMLVQIASQVFATPPLERERAETAVAATLVDRAVAAIATVKAFNAQPTELAHIGLTLDRIRAAADGCNSVWAVTSGLSQFATYAMFVQGFWFGARQVRAGHLSAGDVMAVFWACLIATSNMQMAIPQLVAITKGKLAMAALAATAAPVEGSHKRARSLRKIQPRACAGELELAGVSFAYPSRPAARVLDDVSLFFAAGDLTFVVGGSGSGKSTVAQLLLRMYAPTAGSVLLDEQALPFLDEAWTRQQIACVSQQCLLFDRSVHDNVAMGLAGPGSLRRPEHATREEVIDVCRAAMMHEFVRDLPDGYDTILGPQGASLSGGQKQRLAIARALLRNPTVLILDEATSALDATSRVLVFEAIKRHRRNMTTIVITHDLSQVEDGDFLYVLKHGRLVEQGFRHDLEADPFSTFRDMADSQGALGGFPVRDLDADAAPALDTLLDEPARGVSRLSLYPGVNNRLTFNNWMLDAVNDLSPRPTQSCFIPIEAFAHDEEEARLPETPRRRLSFDMPSPTAQAFRVPRRRLSLQFVPKSPAATHSQGFDVEAAPAREARPRRRHEEKPVATEIVVETPATTAQSALRTQIGFWRLMMNVYPPVQCKLLVCLGLFFCLASGAMTPIFSYLLSRVMSEVSIGAKHSSTINWYGAAVLFAAAADGAFMGLKFLIMEKAAMRWVTDVRKRCLERVLAQDKKWFDKSENSPSALVQILIKDGDDARGLIATVLGQLVVVTAMLSVGLVWALCWGWQLTLVGLAVAPVFAFVMALQTRLVSNCEMRNKRAKEEVAKSYYETVLNIRSIRAMGFEDIFKSTFGTAATKAYKSGVRGSFIEGCTYGIASALIYVAEAVLFYVGAVLIARGTYTYLQMIDVLNLVVFTVTIGAQLMTFTERIAKSLNATRDFDRLLQLSAATTDEAQGTLRPAVAGAISFRDVHFAYPERPDVPVLQGLSLDIRPDECVAVVGASGSGKSTVAALLQRLYEPTAGRITLDGTNLRRTDVAHLREHVAVVSQHANLFDATIAENIAYGRTGGPDPDAVRRAAMDAHVHEFIASLPAGYDTAVGENAALISGGQAQRIQIARALARPSRVLVLDECTSALDGANQAAVLATVRRAAAGRATLVITHKLPAMRMCDRIVLIADGRVAEEGTFDELTQRKGLFSQLARGGEWES